MKRLLCVLLCLLLLTGCGAGSSANYKTEAAAPMMMNSAMGDMVMEEAMEVSGSLRESGTESGSTALPENRKWIITVYMDAEAEDLDATVAGIDEHIAGMGGYVEDQSVYNGSTYDSRRYRNASLTIRIPAETVDEFTEKVGGIANVVRKEKNLEDITLSYTATENRVTALETEQTRLLELLAEAETMSDLLEIEARLTDVRYELETVTSQLRLYNNQIDFATIYLNVSEVQEYTPVEEPTLWERISGGFTDSLEGVRDGAVDLFVWLIASSPYLAVFAVLAALVILPLRRLRLSRRKKNSEPKE